MNCNLGLYGSWWASSVSLEPRSTCSQCLAVKWVLLYNWSHFVKFAEHSDCEKKHFVLHRERSTQCCISVVPCTNYASYLILAQTSVRCCGGGGGRGRGPVVYFPSWQRGSNTILIVDEDFRKVEVRHAGENIPTHGFSSFKVYMHILGGVLPL